MKLIKTLILFVLGIAGCRETPVPKPRGFFRIDLPEKEYLLFNASSPEIPVVFEYPSYGSISFKTDDISNPGWVNIDFPAYKARIYMTYREINNDLEALMEQSYRLNIKNHIIKADAINETPVYNEAKRVFGMIYDLKGSTATAIQFALTDSVKHYFRGSLYFESEPNPDSLDPVISFFREDIIHLVETLEWKKL